MPKHRTQRVAEELKKEIAVIIRDELKDPDIPVLSSVMNVECTQDMKFAKVFISIYGKDVDTKKAMKAFARSAGMVRTLLSRRMMTRTVPELHFVLDDSISYSMHINELLQQIKTEEAETEENDEQP